MKRTIVTAMIALAASGVPAWAGTKLSGSVVATPPDCYTGPDFCKNGLPIAGGCGSDNANCQGGASMKGKLVFSDRLAVKLSVTGLTDNDGNLVTTDPADPLDDHVLKLSLNHCITETGIPSTCNTPVDVYVKVDYSGGKAKVSADLSLALPSGSAGSAVWLRSASLQAYANSPASCGGDNAPETIAMRNDNVDCDNGLIYAVFGVLQP